jgi:subtilisin family serine protease
MRILPEPRRPAGAQRHCAVETLETVLAAAADTGGDWQHALSGSAGWDLTGAGQTVVVIDSGIAYDHAALGGGFGPNYRVVGGWDFAENDADPYDDGPMGSHGTHIAGIIASAHETARGLAPGVDLVALRVFDDDGNSDLAWIEQALDWVHEHRLAFRSPITTVNLSIGMRWNGASVPNWTTIEDELAALEADGIFTAVAAGNGFAEHQVVGLNYPAASAFVVPVMSVEADGQLSSFSQRHERAIAAPGRQIRSTVPDYAGNFNYRTDDFAVYTGTSMAAPYVAAASVIVRQAMHRAGQDEISQDAIESVLRSTADTTFDPVTGQSYLRLNLARAVDTIMPDEESVPPTTPTTTTPTTTTPTTTTPTTTTTTPTTTTTDVVVDYVQPVTFPPRSGQTIFRIGATRERTSWIGRRSWDWSVGRGTGVADTSTLSAGRASIRLRRLNTSYEREAASFDAVHAQAARDTTDVAAADNVYTEIGR